MSYTILHAVPATGPIRTYREFQNSHLWAKLYWDWLAKKYLNLTPAEMFENEPAYKNLWALNKNKDVPVEYRIGLRSTFDWVMVKNDDIPRLIPAFNLIAKDSNNERWKKMAHALETYLKKPEDSIAVCWTVTSITYAWYVPYIVNGEEDLRLYDISKNNRHWFLFDNFVE